MIEIQYEAEVRCSAEKVFNVIVDLHGYDGWLPASKVYLGLTEISTAPVGLGTTYVESGPGGVRHGAITQLEPPTQVVFHQPMTMKPRFLGVIDIRVRYTLTATADSTRVRRLSTIAIPWQLAIAQPLILHDTRAENERTLLVLKAFADDLS